MKNSIFTPDAKSSNSLKTCTSWLLFIILLFTLNTETYAQCTGGSCNSTVNANGSFTIPAGQTYCLQKNNYIGNITFGAGSILCIGVGITWNAATFTFSGATGTINNYGTSSANFTLPNGYTFNNYSTYSGTLTQSTGSTLVNAATFSGTLAQNGGTATNNAGATMSGNNNVGGTLVNNGSINNNITISGTGAMTNNNSVTGNINGIASGGTYTNSSTGTTTDNISSSSGSTITNSGTMTINGGTISGTFITTSGSLTTNTNGTINGTSTIGGSLNNNATMSGNITVSATGTLSTGSNLSGALIVNGTFNVNSGASPSIASVTVNNGGTITNRGTIQGGTLTANAGSTINNYSIINDVSSISGALNNYNGANISGAMTGNVGSVITNFSGAQITAPSSIAGTLNNNSGATISNPVTENAGGNITNAGSMSAGATVNGGTFTETNTGTITNGGAYNITVNGGSVTLNSSIANVSVTGGVLNNNATITNQINVSGGVVNNAGTISGSYTQNGGTVNNSGTINPSSLHLNAGTDSITNQSGGTLTFPSGSNTLPNGLVVTNLGTFNIPAGTNPLIVSAGATLNLEGTQNMSSAQLTDNGTINLLGSLTVATYTGIGVFNEINGGCNIFTTSSNSGTTTFNGGNATYGGGLIVNTAGGILVNGASATITAPTQQGTGLSIPLTVNTVNGSFTSPSAAISGYIVLRYVGIAATSDNPTNYATYSVGSTIGSSTVAAIITNIGVGIRTFTDNIPGGNCGKNVYYRIFSYNGSGTCRTFDLTGPLTGSVAIPVFSTSISASGPTTFCSGSSVTLTSASGTSYAWSTGATSVSISATTSATYTVTTTNNQSCTATASSVVTVNASPTASVTPISPSICAGSSVTITASGGGTYAWSTGASTAAISASTAATYTVTVTNGSGCTATASSTVTVNALPTPAITNGFICSGNPTTITASGGGTYLWNTGASIATIPVSTAATYSVTVTNASNCSASASRTVAAVTSPTVTASSNSPVALGGTINLTSSPAGGASPFAYSWSGPSSYSNATQNPSISAITAANLGTYTITVTDNNTCTATASTLVNTLSPGGVVGNLVLWLKANSIGLTNGSLVSTWTNSIGGNNLNQLVPTSQPTFYNTSTDYINYYPVVNFNGVNNEMTATSFSGASTFTQAHVFVVAKSANNTQTSSIVYENQATVSGESGRINVHLPWSGTTFWDAGTCCTNNRLTTNFPATYVNVPKLWSFSKDLAGTANGSQKQDIRTNGLTVATLGTNTNFTGNNSTFDLGSYGGGGYYNGEVAEVIYYLGATINAVSQNKIESYLALKYGITLDQTTAQSYTASSGTIMWDATVNGVFNKNIFGVGIDNASSLSQTQSQSINTNILTISNASGLVNNSFFVVSDSGGTNSLFPTPALPNTINARISNTWRASKVGTNTAQTLIYNTATVNYGYYNSLSASLVPYLLIDANADGIFESYVAATSVSGTNVTFNTNLSDGTRFTFGFKASIDYGDAWGVPTTIANNGAAHVIKSGVQLGALIDAEVDGQPSVNAAGDDTLGLADEDGVDFNIGVATNNQNILQVGITNSVRVTASIAGYLDAWIDYNHDNTYGGGSEYAIQKVPLVAGVNVVNFNISDSVLYGATSMRFRFAQNTGDVTGPTGLAPNGEVEDYKVYVTAPLVAACTNGFQNPSFEMGPYPSTYIITNQSNVHYWRTTASDQQIEVWNSGYNGVPSYNGQYFVELNANMPAALYQDVYTIPGTAVIWHFAHRGRAGVDSCNLKIGAPGATVTKKIVGDGPGAWGVYTGAYVIPANQYITRFEFNALYAVGGLSVGNFIDDMSVSASFDYGDAPDSYGTLKASNGPFHALTGNLYLGANVSCEGDGQPSAPATLDTYDDGVTFPPVCTTCSSYSVSISVYNNTGSPATIAGWIDFNKNGVFDPTERVSVNVPNSASQQTVTMTFNTTLSMLSPAVNGKLYARFRIANDSTEIANPTGLATSGEVEDYLVPCSSSLALPVPSSNSPVCAGSILNLSTTTTAGAYYFWSGPNGFSASGSTASRANINIIDSGLYRVYSVYANGCETDSAITRVVVNQCYMNVNGSIFDDANGDGQINGSDVATAQGQVIYAVLVDTTNTVLVTTTIAANGTFTLANTPAYRSGMSVIASTTNPSVGTAAPAASWPSNWVGTQGQYGTNNLAGSGIYTSPSKVSLSTGISNITNLLIGYDRLPTSTVRTYTIPHPAMNSSKSLTPANGFGLLAGSDPEDGTYTTGSNFIITSVAGMNNNSLYYDANGDGVLQSYEKIVGYTVITNFDATKLVVKFTGAGSVQAAFNYAVIDAASQITPAPAAYTIKWVTALPVKMLYLTADKKGNDQSQLKWATASEIGNDHFDIERSADGEVWDKIGEVKGSGTTSEEQDYSFLDEQALIGTNYYRLKQVDVDGRFQYTEIVEVTFAAATPSASLSLYPNPLSQSSKLNIELSGSTEDIREINITNSLGQIVYNVGQLQIQNYQISGLDLPAGVYILSIRTQSERVLSGRLVIAH